MIDFEKTNCLKLKLKKLHQKLSEERDLTKRRRFQMEIKVCELKIMIAQIK